MTLPLMLLTLLLGGGPGTPAPAHSAPSPSAPAQAAPAITTPAPQQDTELATLRAKYAGKDVWVYGGGPLRCLTQNGFAEISGPFADPVRVVGLERLAGTVNRNRRVLPDLPIKNPLLLRVRVPGSFKQRSWGMGGNSASFRPLERPNCREFLLPFVDEADLLQSFSLTPPDAVTRKALAPFQKPNTSASTIGLTHQQVLWLSGVLDEPRGTLTRLLQAPAWIWYGPPGYGDHVLYFQNDRVVKVDVPRMGP